MATSTNLEALRSNTYSPDTESVPTDSPFGLLDLPTEITNTIARHILLDEQDALPYRPTKLDTSLSGVCKQLQKNHEYTMFSQLPWALVFLNEHVLMNNIAPIGGIQCSYAQLARIRPVLLMHIYQNEPLSRVRCKRLLLMPLVFNHFSDLLGQVSYRLCRIQIRLHDQDRHIGLYTDMLELLKHQTRLTCLLRITGNIPGVVNAKHNNTTPWKGRGRGEVLQHMRELISFVSKYSMDHRIHEKHTTLLTANIDGLQAAGLVEKLMEDGFYLTR